MKNIYLFLAALFFSSFSSGQNQVHLNSGEIIECKVVSLNNNDLVVTFKNNKIHLKLKDVSSIVFNDEGSKPDTMNQYGKTDFKNGKQESKMAVAEPKAEKPEPKPEAKPEKTETKPDKGIIKGNVNFYSASSQYGQADLGSEIYIYAIENDTTDPSKASQTIENFENGLNKFVTTLLNSQGYFSEELDMRAYKDLTEITHNSKKTLRMTVDQNGRYSAKLNPGYYEVVIVSKGRKGQSKTETGGRVYAKWVDLKAGEAEVISCEFKQY